MSKFPRILGIDPGSRVIGFALIGAKKQCPRSPVDWMILDAGVVRASTDLVMPARLGEIHNAFYDLTTELCPTAVGIEKSFHGVNSATTIKLGEARGALLAAVGRHGLPVHEITPAQVKRLVAGNGAASKEEVYQALQVLMGFNRGHLPHDASDALAIALSVSLSAFLPVSISNKRKLPTQHLAKSEC